MGVVYINSLPLSIVLIGGKMQIMWITFSMLNIHIIAVGKLKDSYVKTVQAEYLKRLKPYGKITVTELPEEPFRTQADWVKVKQREAAKILTLINPQDIVIALHETGVEYTSIAFADFLKTNSEQGQRLVLIIGGPLGLDTSILQKARTHLSLSKLTFTHQMVRPLLLEQLYRAATIIAHKQYHY